MSGSHDFEPINPIDLPLTHQASPSREPVPWQQRRSTWAALAICVLLALLVIFVLPSLVQPPQQPPVLIDTAAENRPALAESPFRDAELAKARRAAQDVLAKILEQKTFLEQKNVQLWGQEEFERALQSATEGDLNYRQRAFDLAQASYQQALERMQALESALPEILKNALAEGMSALDTGDGETATERFKLVQAVEPDNTDAAAGLARAAVLDQVMVLLNQADIALQNNQLEQARKQFSDALALDGASTRAQQGLQQVNQQLHDLAFNDAMSRGFSALESNQLPRARAAFKEALKLDPDSQAVRTALSQVDSTATKHSIQALMNSAEGQEKGEQWHQARDNYGKILTIDSSVMSARLGQLRSSARADLDDRINKILNEPLRLSSTEVLKQARQVLADARGIQQPGPRLKEQVVRLERTIAAATTPQTVEVLSDNDTRVTLYKVGELGQFNRKQLSLVPGNYVAVGSRPGYRDVRVEFQVTSNGRDKPVIVVCTEPVS